MSISVEPSCSACNCFNGVYTVSCISRAQRSAPTNYGWIVQCALPRTWSFIPNSVPLISKQHSFYPLCIHKQYANHISTWKQLGIFVLSLFNVFHKAFTYSLRRLSRPQPNSFRFESDTPAVSADSMDRSLLEWISHHDVASYVLVLTKEIPRIFRQVIDHTCTFISLLSWAHLKCCDESILSLRAEYEGINHYSFRITNSGHWWSVFYDK